MIRHHLEMQESEILSDVAREKGLRCDQVESGRLDDVVDFVGTSDVHFFRGSLRSRDLQPRFRAQGHGGLYVSDDAGGIRHLLWRSGDVSDALCHPAFAQPSDPNLVLDHHAFDRDYLAHFGESPSASLARH
jgi:hypothetical protein